jgi:hypothetical protein
VYVRPIVEFRLLGPLDVSADGRALPLGGPQQRAILALLLLHPEQVVSIDRLIDELWGERPPKAARAVVQNCIWRLRAALGTDLIERRPPGYVLHVDLESIDSHRFERLVEAGKISSLRACRKRPRGARAWRGPPSPTPRSSVARPEIATPRRARSSSHWSAGSKPSSPSAGTKRSWRASNRSRAVSFRRSSRALQMLSRQPRADASAIRCGFLGSASRADESGPSVREPADAGTEDRSLTTCLISTVLMSRRVFRAA